MVDTASPPLFLRTVVRPLVIVLVAGLVGFAFARFTAPNPRAELNPEIAIVPVAERIALATPSGSSNRPAISSRPADPRTPRSLEERFATALNSNNHFASAANALAIIDAMTAEDFRELIAKPSHFPWSYGFDGDFQNALMDAVIARWLIVDPLGAPAAIRQAEELLKKDNMSSAGSFSAALARVQPEAILNALPEQASWSVYDYTIPNALTALAARDATAARRYMERITDPQLRKSAEVAIAMGIAKNDPVSAVTLAHSMESTELFQTALVEAERIGPGILRQVLAANDGKFPIGNRLVELVFRYPEEDWVGFMSSEEEQSFGVSTEALQAADRLTATQRAGLLNRLEKMPDGMREDLTGALIFGWARDEPQAALEWAFARAKPSDGDAAETKRVGAAFFPWMCSDEAAAVHWWSRLPESPMRSFLGNTIAHTAAERGEYDRALALFHPLPGPEAAMIAATIAEAGADRDPSLTAQWLDSLSADFNSSQAVATTLKHWIARDSTAAVAWVERQPAGARRHAAIQSYASVSTMFDPAAAGEWASTIQDPELRLIATEYVFIEMNRRDPAAAQTWLRAFPSVESVWCERLIRLQP